MSQTRNEKIRKLDQLVSEYVRKRDCENPGTCISCGRPINFSTCECGHYIDRKHMATRFDENNCNAECPACNRFDATHLTGYKRNLTLKIGLKSFCEIEAKKYTDVHFSEREIEEMITYYKQLLKN